MENNPVQNIGNKIDGLIGKKIALASNSVLPLAGPLLINSLWKYKHFLLLIPLSLCCLILFVLQSITLQFITSAKSYLDNIPEDQRVCIQLTSQNYQIEFELLASFSQVIANYDTSHVGSGIGFLEISETTWQNFGVDGDNNEIVTHNDMCDNYATLANKLKSLEGDSVAKIEAYNAPQKEEIKKVYELLTGINLVPYGNPIGLFRTDLVTMTSGYGETRVINGIINVHTGLDLVPSQKWYQENPGASITSAVNKSILSGTVSEFIDSQGALCAYVENPSYRTLYCHCNSFIAPNGATVKYGDAICYLGSTGFSTGPHVHIEVFIKSSTGTWNRVDPAPFIFPQSQ